jgi:hypothetical protein
VTPLLHNMETLICAGKITGWMATSALIATALDAATSVPVLWLVVGVFTLGGGIWKLSSILTNIEDRLKHLESAKRHRDENSGAQGD